MWKNEALMAARKLGLMPLVDRLFYRFNAWRYGKKNAVFQARYPGFALPPPYMIYEAYRLDYGAYYRDGMASAREIKEALDPYTDWQGVALLDWGCGPARVVRHWPALLPGNCSVHGTDYNAATIRWCRQHIPGVQFGQNGLEPPTGYPGSSFHIIYGISVLTHLSEKNHAAWLAELYRLLQPGGLLYLTTHGDAFREKLTAGERRLYDAGRLVVRSHVQEGHRAYSAFQPPAYLKSLFGNRWKERKFAPGKKESWGFQQDTWIIQKIE
ncbi:MAG TPA: class I SAM-dependent methyltransferase [Chitinophagaceae bacterium]|jgi:SAM-dependent methyltransferase|nr:class I SAM-dependent methyltransferase [Chitinophagaceae bacterium]